MTKPVARHFRNVTNAREYRGSLVSPESVIRVYLLGRVVTDELL
jgi:hypothetical protein